MLIATIEQDEQAAIKAIKAEARAISAAAAKDAKAASELAKTKAKAIAARGTPAKAPGSAAPTDVSIGLRSGAVPNLKERRLPSSIGLTLPGVGPLRIDLNVRACRAVRAQLVASL